MKENLVQRLIHQPKSLDQLLENFSEKIIRERPIPEKWSIFENIAHLGRYHEVVLERTMKILNDDNPVFSRYVADTDPLFAEWCKKSFPLMMDEFNSTREYLNSLMVSIPNEKLHRTGVHPLFGNMNIEAWTEFFLLHEAHHFFTIFKLAATLRSKN